MGQMIPSAVLSTIVERDGNETFRVAMAEVNGWRNSMEDAHVIHMRKNEGFFGVLDGPWSGERGWPLCPDAGARVAGVLACLRRPDPYMVPSRSSTDVSGNEKHRRS